MALVSLGWNRRVEACAYQATRLPRDRVNIFRRPGLREDAAFLSTTSLDILVLLRLD